MRTFRLLLVSVGGVAALALVVLTIFVVTFDAETYKPRLVDLVKEETGRTLAIEGPIRLRFFPTLAATVGHASLSVRGGVGTFAAVDEARVGLALLPLLRKAFVLERVELSGLSAELVRYRDGRTNFDDLLGRGDELTGKSAPSRTGPRDGVRVGVEGVDLRNSDVRWRDEAEGIDVRLTRLDIHIDRIATGVPGQASLSARVIGAEPKLDAHLAATAGYELDFGKNACALSDLDVRLEGDAFGARGLVASVKGDAAFDRSRSLVDLDGFSLSATTKDGLTLTARVPKLRIAPQGAAGDTAIGEARIVRADRTIDAKLALSSPASDGKRVTFEHLALDARIQEGPSRASAKLAGPVVLDLAAQRAELDSLTGELVVAGPQLGDQPFKASIAGSARVHWKEPGSANAELLANFERSNLNIKVAVTRFEQPAVQFDIAADRLDFDRYFPRTSAPGRPDAASSASRGRRDEAAGKPIDLSLLKRLDIAGNVRIGHLATARVKADSVALGVHGAGGRLEVSPFSASVYGGSLSGSFAVDANTSQWTLRQQLTGVSVGPLLRDLAGLDKLEGRGTMSLDVATTGTTLAAMRSALAGNARVTLKEGAIKGVNLSQLTRQASALLGSRQALEREARAGERTEFSDLSASFAIRNGVAHNDDLSFRSPALRATGTGRIDLASETIDYTLRATLLGVEADVRNRVIARIGEVTLPVHVAGPLASPKYTVDIPGLATGTAQQEIAKQIEKRLGGQRGQDKGQGGSSGAVNELLRGLLKR